MIEESLESDEWKKVVDQEVDGQVDGDGHFQHGGLVMTVLGGVRNCLLEREG